MRNWFLISMLSVVVAAVTMTASGPDAKELAQKGHAVFLEVLGGDTARLPEAIRYMEDSKTADPKSAENLYNLARAYFYDGLAHGKVDSLSNAEKNFAAILQLEPNNSRALSFHGSTLSVMGGQGGDFEKFMQGADEMKSAVQKDPNELTNRIVIAFSANNFPPEALAAMGGYDNLNDLEYVRDFFNGKRFSYAPHADTVSKALVGDAYKKKGDETRARENFEAALAVPKPSMPAAVKGREVIDGIIRARMNGDSKPLYIGLLGSCHACHLSAPEKLGQ